MGNLNLILIKDGQSHRPQKLDILKGI